MQRRKFLTNVTAISVLNAPIYATESVVFLSEPTAKGFVIKAGQSRFGEKTKLFGTTSNDIKVSGKDTDGTLSIFEYASQEKGGPPMHINHQQDEIFYVIDGTYQFALGNERHTLVAGDLLFAPRNVAHTFAQLSPTGRLLFLIQPAGSMEDYFRTLGTLSGKLTPDQATSLFAKHGLQLVGPPLSLD